MLVEKYGDLNLLDPKCTDGFKGSGIRIWDVRTEDRGKPPKYFEDSKLQTMAITNRWKTEKIFVKFLLDIRYKISVASNLRLLAMRNGFIFRILIGQNHYFIRVKQKLWIQNQINCKSDDQFYFIRFHK